MKTIRLLLLLLVPTLLCDAAVENITTPTAAPTDRPPQHPSPGLKLAQELVRENQHRAAAIEYRRLALKADTSRARAGYWWGAAYTYLQHGDAQLALKMLDQAEDVSPDIGREATLLRMEVALAQDDTQSAGFFADSLAHDKSPALRHLARLRQTHLALLEGKPALAATRVPKKAPEAVTHAITTYANGHDKNPRLGGMLGLVPGLGYAYAGEYANALRSLLLNGLFIYGMTDTAENDDWGAFSIITFFEITWYTGSIYGGIDATHRYNQRRLNATIQVLDEHARFSPSLNKLPAIVITYTF